MHGLKHGRASGRVTLPRGSPADRRPRGARTAAAQAALPIRVHEGAGHRLLLPTTPVWRRSHASQIHYIVIEDRPTLVWAASIAALELHPFLHRRAHLDRPTLIVFDLDPGPPAGLRDCIEVALLIREELARLKLRAWAKVSGSKGVQVYVPLNTPVTYDETQPFARALAEWLAERHPDRVVAAMKKALRGGKVFIDWSQNADFKTTVGAYSLRAKKDRPYVSMPVTWEELRHAARKGTADALFWEPGAALARIAKLGDLFAPVLTTRQRLPVFAQPPRASRAPRPRTAPAPTRS